MPCALLPTSSEKIWGHNQLSQSNMPLTSPMCEDTVNALVGCVPGIGVQKAVVCRWRVPSVQ